MESNPADKCWSCEELFWYKWLNERNYTTLWVDGNHENFDRIKTYPVTEWHGGRVQMISESIIHLMRGEIYEINGLSVFTFGGAMSVDRGPALGKEESEKEQYRARDEHICWWPEEEPSQEERDNALNNLAAHGNKVDIIVTHEAPRFILCLREYLQTAYQHFSNSSGRQLNMSGGSVVITIPMRLLKDTRSLGCCSMTLLKQI